MTYDPKTYAAKGFRTQVAVIAEHAAAYPDAIKAKDKVCCGCWRRVLCPLLTPHTCAPCPLLRRFSLAHDI